MTNEIKVIHFCHVLIVLHRCKINTSLQKHITDFSFVRVLAPLADKRIQGCVFTADIILGVIHDTFLTEQLSVSIINGNRLVNNLHFTTIFGYDRLYLGRPRRNNRSGTGRRGGRRVRIGIEAGIDFNRTIPIRIGKQSADITEVHDHKMGFAFLFAQTGTTANNLLEFGHGANHFIKHDQLGHLAVCTGREQLGGSCNNRVWSRNRNEIVQLALTVHIATGDADNVVWIILDHVRVQIHKCLTHTLCSIFVGTENDGFCHTVGTL